MDASHGRNSPLPLALDGAEAFVLIDNVSDGESTLPDGVTGESANLLAAGVDEFAGDRLCCACWGYSLVVTTRIGDTTRTVLFDAGPAGFAVDHNVPLVGIDMGSIEAVVLSHGHTDHGGALPTALRHITEGNGGRPVPVHVNPGMFVHRGERLDDGGVLPYRDVPSPAELEAAGGRVVNDYGARLMADDMVYLSGEIPRVTPYETGIPVHVKRNADDTDWEPDPLLMDERFLAIHLRDKGVIVFTACSHAGVVNVLRHAREVFDPIPLYGVMGGFHLWGPAGESRIAQTVDDLRDFDLKMIVPGHCTGWRATYAMVDAFGEDVVVPSAVARRHRW